MSETHNSESHKWLRYGSRLADRSLSRRVVQDALNYMCNQTMSVAKWQKTRQFGLRWTDKAGVTHVENVSFEAIVDRVRAVGRLDLPFFKLPLLASRTVPIEFETSRVTPPIEDHTGRIKIASNLAFGGNLPLQPILDREGVIYTSLLPHLMAGAANYHAQLVEASDLMLNTDGRWLNLLRLLASDVVAALDACLNSLYIRAEYNPKPDWRFQLGAVGHRHGRRLREKLDWVYMITGRRLDALVEELDAFGRIKGIRNHLNHFDPPCFAYSIDDVSNWLNDIPKIGSLIWKIQQRMGEPISNETAALVLLREVEIVPRDRAIQRPAQEQNCGYASSRWKEAGDGNR